MTTLPPSEDHNPPPASREDLEYINWRKGSDRHWYDVLEAERDRQDREQAERNMQEMLKHPVFFILAAVILFVTSVLDFMGEILSRLSSVFTRHQRTGDEHES